MSHDWDKPVQLHIIEFFKQIAGRLQERDFHQYMLSIVGKQTLLHAVVKAFVQHVFGSQAELDRYVRAFTAEEVEPLLKKLPAVLCEIRHDMGCQKETFHPACTQEREHPQAFLLQQKPVIYPRQHMRMDIGHARPQRLFPGK